MRESLSLLLAFVGLMLALWTAFEPDSVEANVRYVAWGGWVVSSLIIVVFIAGDIGHRTKMRRLTAENSAEVKKAWQVIGDLQRKYRMLKKQHNEIERELNERNRTLDSMAAQTQFVMDHIEVSKKVTPKDSK